MSLVSFPFCAIIHNEGGKIQEDNAMKDIIFLLLARSITVICAGISPTPPVI